MITVSNPTGVGSAHDRYIACDDWHTWAVRTINRLAPSMLVVSQDSDYTAPGPKTFTATQWGNGLTKLFGSITSPHTDKIFLGNIPLLTQSPPTCLSAHLDSVGACSVPVARAYRPFDKVEFSVTQSLHVRYVDPTPWFCSTLCTAIVGTYDVYMDRFHVTATYATYLQRALAAALFGPTAPPTRFVPELMSRVLRPSSGATLSGNYWLAAGAIVGNSPVVRIDFLLSGGGIAKRTVCVAQPSLIGWWCDWNTSTVANGHYTLRAVASNAEGKTLPSGAVSVSVKN
jgi:hypothetical protein